MRILWDEVKRRRNLDRHKLDFGNAAKRFAWQEAIIIPGHAGSDGRVRFRAIGFLDDRLVTLVLAPLGSEAISLISLRPASRVEWKLHGRR